MSACRLLATRLIVPVVVLAVLAALAAALGVEVATGPLAEGFGWTPPLPAPGQA
ncbi:hypothetical protein [Micromonospora echinaurantiaca]|uniref:hypothetical protein n=1 Tax=Micromonospora echinaurantiaca TaxID=47857 RepID=UPI003428FF93